MTKKWYDTLHEMPLLEIILFEIYNRRYLGGKFKLLNFIDEIVQKHCKDCVNFADLFGGTGVVAHYFNKKYDIIVNDILMSNFVCYQTFFSDQKIDQDKLIKIIAEYNEIDLASAGENYYSINFSDTFLSKENMKRIGMIRNDIDHKVTHNLINQREKSVLITSLLYAIDKIANTVGHYDAFRRTGDLSKTLKLDMPVLRDELNHSNLITQSDANLLVQKHKMDIVYIDPPYNSRQYCDAYHFLENVAENKEPEVMGVARKMNRAHLKSEYCKNKASTQFKQLIQDIDAKYILVSYNNTADKINSRSNSKISDLEMIEILESKGKLFIYEKEISPFTTGKTNLPEHKERLFVCEVGIFAEPLSESNELETSELIKSPLNYTGGKAKLFPQIKQKLPLNIESFYDVFSGGATLGVNVSAHLTYCVDNNQELIDLMNYIKASSYSELVTLLEQTIKHYGLSDSFTHGYEFYHCNSSHGLGTVNKEPFNRLKKDYNQSKESLLFLLLIIFGFNNQIRFNKKGEFNIPVGKRDFNSSLRKKLRLFMQRIKTKKIEFLCKDFRALDLEQMATEKAFLYLDPPYILGIASYNENRGWSHQDESDLLTFLTQCHRKGILFALSNVIKHKGKIHTQLLEWSVENACNIHYLSHHYSNSNYQIKDKRQETQEVLITNY